jgi:hypothetical protein
MYSETMANVVTNLDVVPRMCKVTCRDKGVEHTVEVTAESLYEAVARGLVAFREPNGWATSGKGRQLSQSW